MRKKRKIVSFSVKRLGRRPETDKDASKDLLVKRAAQALRELYQQHGEPVSARQIREAAIISLPDWAVVADRLLDEGLAAKNDASEWTPASSLEESFANLLMEMPDWPLFVVIHPRDHGISAARLRSILKTLEKDAGVRAVPMPGQRGAWATTRQRLEAAEAMARQPANKMDKGRRLEDLLTPGMIFIIRALGAGPMRAVDLTKRAAAAKAERPTTASGAFAAMIRAGLVVPLPPQRRRRPAGPRVSEHVQWALSASGLAAAAALDARNDPNRESARGEPRHDHGDAAAAA